jgi:signal transduction histidine kinase
VAAWAAGGTVRSWRHKNVALERANRGLVGMRERAAMFGGDLQALPRPEGGFAVRARLPLTTPAPA